MLIKQIMKWLVDTEGVARVIEVLDRRSDNRMTELGMLSQAFEFVKINEVPGDYFEFGLWRGKTFGYAHRMKRRYGQRDMKLWDLTRFRGYLQQRNILITYGIKDSLPALARNSRRFSHRAESGRRAMN